MKIATMYSGKGYSKNASRDSGTWNLKEQNVSLSKFAYTTLIKAHCVKGDPEMAVKLFHQLLHRGFNVSIRDYSAVINRLCRRHLVNESKFFFCLMLSQGISPDLDICEVMIKSDELLSWTIKWGLLPD